jgi:hypothetical protein
MYSAPHPRWSGMNDLIPREYRHASMLGTPVWIHRFFLSGHFVASPSAVVGSGVCGSGARVCHIFFSFRLKFAGLYRAPRTACGKAQGSWTKKAGARRILFFSGGKYCQRLASYRLVHKLAISKTHAQLTELKCRLSRHSGVS